MKAAILPSRADPILIPRLSALESTYGVSSFVMKMALGDPRCVEELRHLLDCPGKGQPQVLDILRVATYPESPETIDTRIQGLIFDRSGVTV
jgi:hypothetical protein